MIENSYFQALGYVKGSLLIKLINGKETLFLKVGKKEYKLKGKRDQIKKLKGLDNHCQVYPITDLKSKITGFKLNRYFANPKPWFIENQFILRGIWQVIPQVNCPVITVYRNALNYPDEPATPLHIPVIWNNPIIEPCRSSHDQFGQFVQIKACLNPNNGKLTFDSLLDLPSQEIPTYMEIL